MKNKQQTTTLKSAIKSKMLLDHYQDNVLADSNDGTHSVTNEWATRAKKTWGYI